MLQSYAYKFIGAAGNFKFRGIYDISSSASDIIKTIRSTVLIFGRLGNKTILKCSETAECNKNHCIVVQAGEYRCRCNIGYGGNPYLDSGCQGQFYKKLFVT